MRTCWLLLPAIALAAPAATAHAASAAATPNDDKSAATAAAAEPRVPVSDFRVPPELTDPAAMARMTAVLSALARAVMDMPVGEVQAAAQGRAPTAADKGRTVREVAGAGDADFERRVQSEIASSQGVMQAGLKAMMTAMPAIVRAMNEAGAEVGKAVANLPRPDYPRR